jgi:hypothetical protein
MESKVIFNTDLHFEHMQWKKELLFWKDEIRSFQNRLDEIVKRWTDHKILAELGQFQNNFTIHNNKIKELMEQIEAHEHSIAIHFQANEDAIDRVGLKHHESFRDKLNTQRKLYNDLKHKYYIFLTKYM